MKIAMCASEVVPFAKTGGLADVVGALPQALEDQSQEVIIIMPAYKSIHNAKCKIQRLKGDISYSIIKKNIKVYFIGHAEYFNRDCLYGDKSGDYKDNLERFSYFCKSALALLKELNFQADIIHVHDWQACLVPVYLKTIYKDDAFFQGTKTVLTIHNIGYQGLFPKDEFPKLGLDWSLFGIEGLEFYGRINLLKAGMEFCDIMNTVSPTYSRQIQTKDFGFGLDGVLLKRRDLLFGILNGIDYAVWNPATDKFIAKNFSASHPQGKAVCKEDLQAFCKLPCKKNVPLIGIVSRLAEQKGFDILAESIDSICKMDIQMVILGTGDLKYHLVLEKMLKKYPKVISLNQKFDDPLAHKIYAGSDIFLMPSKYEPCGLGQLISFRYGTVPLVFKTGGLADTVSKENGFVFDKYTKDELKKTVKKSVTVFEDKPAWSRLMQRAMDYDFSWKESARKYIELYAKAKKG